MNGGLNGTQCRRCSATYSSSTTVGSGNGRLDPNDRYGAAFRATAPADLSATDRAVPRGRRNARRREIHRRAGCAASRRLDCQSGASSRKSLQPLTLAGARPVRFTVDRLDHLVLNCRDVEITAAWYQRVLGMEREDFCRDQRTALKFGGQKLNLRPADADTRAWAAAEHPLPGTQDMCFVSAVGP